MYSKSSLKQALSILIYVSFLILVLVATGSFEFKSINPIETYGYLFATILFTMKLFTFITLPISFLNIIGLMYYKIFPDEQKLKLIPLLTPFICIRVVTKGLFPELVKQNLMRNVQICETFGLTNFIVEVVTDNEIHLPVMHRVREILVPAKYQTRTGARFKARALQYALEDGVNILSDEDWIVHLDEETLLTKSSLVGILNFLYENRYIVIVKQGADLMKVLFCCHVFFF